MSNEKNKACKIFDFVSIKKTLEEKNNIYEEITEEEWEHCVYILFLFMCEQGYDPNKQSEIIEFIKDYFPDTPSENNDNKGNEDD